MNFRPKIIVFLAVSHRNDLGRLQHFAGLLDLEIFRPVFVTYSGFRIEDPGSSEILDLDYDSSSFLRRLKYKLGLWKIQWLCFHNRAHLITHYKNELSEQGTLSKLVTLICKDKGGLLCLSPHGVTSYGLQHEVPGEVIADVLFYNTEFELHETSIKRYLGSSAQLLRTGDLELLNLIRDQQKPTKTVSQHKICILASNLNQFKFTDDDRIKSIVLMIRFANRFVALSDIVFRPHPRFLKYNDKIRELFPEINFDQNKNGKDTILSSDVVISVTSSIAYESILLGKKTIIIEPDEFQSFKCLFRPSPLKHFFQGELPALDLNSVAFDLEKEKTWVRETLTVDRRIVSAQLTRLFSGQKSVED